MSGIIGASPNMRTGIAGYYPTGSVLQTVTNSTTTNHAIGVNSYAMHYQGPYITAKQRNSKYLIRLNSSVISFPATSSSDACDLGIRIRWGTVSGSETNDWGISHSHRFSGTSHWNQLKNFVGMDGAVQNGVGGTTWAGSAFNAMFGDYVNVAAGTPIHWRVDIWAASSIVYWNRTAASATSNIGHSTLEITEIAA